MRKLALMASVALMTFGAAGAANATIVTVFSNWTAGLANFNNTVTGAGGTAKHDTWSSLSFSNSNTQLVRTDYTVTRTGGSPLSNQGVYEAYGSSPAAYTSGDTIGIDPYGGNTDSGHGSNNGLGSKGSGLTFVFNSGINAIGFEVGDWATCCQESDLYISFGNNAPIQVGKSTSYGDQFLTNGGAGVYVAAFDDSDTFDTVHFWGDGWGEYLVMGGTISYSTLDQGSLPPTGVPEPAPIALFGLGLLAMGLMVRRRKAV
ncbi:MAG TPA: PEP-CTERM sorting domain-containing protein [Rhodanobacteraceae bacterium]|nr:PEP-CTERM sorting domain-containing protein [Rhodanobacteraceae bacterium]